MGEVEMTTIKIFRKNGAHYESIKEQDASEPIDIAKLGMVLPNEQEYRIFAFEESKK